MADKHRSSSTVILWITGLLILAGIGWEMFSPAAQARRQVEAIVADGRDRLKQAEARADRLDPGWRMADILARRAKARPPDERNSAKVVEEVLKRLPQRWDQPPKGYHEEPLQPDEVPRGYRLQIAVSDLAANARPTEAIAAGLRAEMDELGEAVAVAERVADFPEGQTSFTLAHHPFEILLPYTQNTRSVVRLLDLDVRRQLADDKPEAALRGVLAMLNVARSIDEPFQISQMVRRVNTVIAVRALERVLGQSVPPEASLASLQNELLQEAEVPRFLVGLRGERAMLYDLCDKLAKGTLTWAEVGGSEDEPSPWLHQPIAIPTEYRHQQAVALETMTDDVEAAKHSFVESREHWDGWQARINALRDTPAKAKANAIPSLFMPLALPPLEIELHTVARLRCAALAIAAERFRQRQNRWPRNTDELIPAFMSETPIDPYDGKSIRMVTTDEGLIVYSVAKDEIDDGGSLDPEDRSQLPGFDVGFRLFSPESRGILTPAATP